MPDVVDGPGIEKAHGIVELPLRVRWSGHPKKYDLRKREDRARVYEQVLREGDDDDVRRFIQIDELARLWDDLVLPRHDRKAWVEWFRQHGRADIAC
ncbi:MAG: hypothetical protein ACRD12_14715 [Acidimicrobiales bacterium]